MSVINHTKIHKYVQSTPRLSGKESQRKLQLLWQSSTQRLGARQCQQLNITALPLLEWSQQRSRTEGLTSAQTRALRAFVRHDGNETTTCNISLLPTSTPDATSLQEIHYSSRNTFTGCDLIHEKHATAKCAVLLIFIIVIGHISTSIYIVYIVFMYMFENWSYLRFIFVVVYFYI